MKINPLKLLESFGQSVWLDYISRDLIASGELRKLINDDGLKGITSNPSIFEQAIAKSSDYDFDIKKLAIQGKSPDEIYESISQHDILRAADELKQVYEKSEGRDGYVSLEVNPHLAHDTNGTIEEARRLWTALNRQNVFIKVPATKEGLPAIQQLITDGINVNVTLLFGLPRYREVIDAYIAGIEARIEQGKPVKNISSVASFFISRIDTIIDPQDLDYMAMGGEQVHFATNIRGQVAISSAKIAYNIYREIFESRGFAQLVEQGARPQRLLWASTGTKNPEYSNIKYIESLIAPNTINTMPPDTMDAYRDHGHPSYRLIDHFMKACWIMSELTELGIDIDQVTQKLEDEGVEKFIVSFDKLLATITGKSLEFLRK